MSATEIVDEVFHALADPTRRQIVQILSTEGEQPAAKIYDRFDISHPAMSQHMNVLKKAGVVSVQKKSQYRIYSINETAIAEIEDWTMNIRRMWERRFQALEKVLETQKQAARKRS